MGALDKGESNTKPKLPSPRNKPIINNSGGNSLVSSTSTLT